MGSSRCILLHFKGFTPNGQFVQLRMVILQIIHQHQQTHSFCTFLSFIYSICHCNSQYDEQKKMMGKIMKIKLKIIMMRKIMKIKLKIITSWSHKNALLKITLWDAGNSITIEPIMTLYYVTYILFISMSRSRNYRCFQLGGKQQRIEAHCNSDQTALGLPTHPPNCKFWC